MTRPSGRQVEAEMASPSASARSQQAGGGRSRLHRGLFEIWRPIVILLIMNALVFGAAAKFVLDRPFGMPDLRDFLAFEAVDDSWKPMRFAHTGLNDPTMKDIYGVIFFDRHIKFQYPLTALLPIELLNRLGISDALTQVHVLNSINWLLICGTMIGIFILAQQLHRRALGIRQNGLKTSIFLFCTVAIATLSFYPITKSYSNGQIQTWINFGWAMLCVLWGLGERPSAGALLGLMCAIKPQLAPLALFACIAKEWRFVAIFLATVSCLLAISLIQYGVTNNIGYIKVLSFLSKHGEAYYANQSINGFLNRLVDPGAGTRFYDGGFPKYSAIVYYGTILSFIVINGVAFIWVYLCRNRLSLLHMSIVVLSTLISSPISWEHHYGVILPIYLIAYIYAYSILQNEPRHRSIIVILLCISFVLSANYVKEVNNFYDTWFNFVQSYLLVGAVILLGCLYFLTYKEPAVTTQRRAEWAGGRWTS